MKATAIQLEVVTPERVVFKEDVEALIVPGVEGYIGVLPNHAPMVVGLRIGVVKYRSAGKMNKMAISGGFLEVAQGNKAVLLADTAERGSEIDVLRAKAAKERAERRLAEKAANLDYNRAVMALQRAIARLKAAEHEDKLR